MGSLGRLQAASAGSALTAGNRRAMHTQRAPGTDRRALAVAGKAR
jgi:hypothetical protein